MITTSNFKPCEHCGKVECNNNECQKNDMENEGGTSEKKSRYRPAKR